MAAMARPKKPKPICIYCQNDEGSTRDHVFPASWYPDTTPHEIQRRTLPCCPACNRRLNDAGRHPAQPGCRRGLLGRADRAGDDRAHRGRRDGEDEKHRGATRSDRPPLKTSNRCLIGLGADRRDTVSIVQNRPDTRAGRMAKWLVRRMGVHEHQRDSTLEEGTVNEAPLRHPLLRGAPSPSASGACRSRATGRWFASCPPPCPRGARR